MTVSSMTGFGSAQRASESFEARVEIRSVNHRALNWKASGIGDLLLESEVDARIRKCIGRGSLTIQVQRSRSQGEDAVCLDRDLARRVWREIGELADELGASKPKFRDLLQVPGLFVEASARAGNDPEARAAQAKLVLGAIDEALDALVEARQREGAALLAALEANLASITELVDEIDGRWPAVLDAQRERLERRVRELLEAHGLHAEQVDVLREVALIAERIDVGEEIERLRTHADELARLLADGGRIGRKADFLAQEMFREVNTIGSKSNDVELAGRVVELKTALDRVREQLQNLE